MAARCWRLRMPQRRRLLTDAVAPALMPGDVAADEQVFSPAAFASQLRQAVTRRH